MSSFFPFEGSLTSCFSLDWYDDKKTSTAIALRGAMAVMLLCCQKVSLLPQNQYDEKNDSDIAKTLSWGIVLLYLWMGGCVGGGENGTG